ncbi:hypothetical protein RFI_10541 [Reticulomyxa filosa]|uniref:Uncharacterized protein n=1 Tax=Reticulomyxa filosa TaxID=46433 RepID=X6NJV8_RETFI|nr:hypothetical protein RFI_10541 [Reticulomyxa filosa]|eukprot:ETO26595.1 hypothetical protein RFI_10541 [Reticulomyxa filosa]
MIVGRVWIGKSLNASQQLKTLDECIMLLGVSRCDQKLHILLDIQRQHQRHETHWLSSIYSKPHHKTSTEAHQKATTYTHGLLKQSIQHSSKNKSNATLQADKKKKKKIIPNQCLAIVCHSRFQESSDDMKTSTCHILFDNNRIIECDYSMTDVFIAPFKLEKKPFKTLHVKGHSYTHVSGVHIHAGLLYVFNKPTDYMYFEIECKNVNSITSTVSDEWFQKLVHCVKLDTIEWLHIPPVDFSVTDIREQTFSGKHLGVLVVNALIHVRIS